MAEVGDGVAVQNPVLRVGDRLVEGVFAHSDRRRAQVELADVDGVERGAEGLHPGVQDVLGAHRVVLEAERADVDLHVHDVVDEVVVLVAAVGGEEHVPVLALDVTSAAEHRHQARDVAVADVVLLPDAR